MPAPHNSADSPVMRQYLEIKSRYADSVLMFRMGDFYEMFFEDAVTVGPVLDIAVTSRDKNAQDPVPMAGVPYHSIGGYLRTLVEQGFKVAICEQLESPEEAKKRKGPHKIVKRDVVRVVTPGALIDEEHLSREEANFFVAIIPRQEPNSEPFGIAAMDISCGEFLVSEAEDLAALLSELARLRPREVLAAPEVAELIRQRLGPLCPAMAPLDQVPSRAQVERVQHLYRVCHPQDPALSAFVHQAAAYALAYAEHTQPGQSLLLHRLRKHDAAQHLVVDDASLRNLEIFATLREGKKRGSLLWAIDRSQTAMGARMMRSWIAAPLREREAIEARLDAVEAALEAPTLRAQIRAQLKDLRDLVRLSARARLGTIRPRELGSLRDSLLALPGLQKSMAQVARPDEAGGYFDLGEDLAAELAETLAHYLVDAPPSVARDGGVIRGGADPDFDRQCELRDGGREALAAIEIRERESTGIANLKVQHNRVFGYFLEVPKKSTAKVPKHYVRKQTMANAERYVTEELAALESKVLGAQALALSRELELFEILKQKASERAELLCELGEKVAQVDVLCAFAELSQEQDYRRPEFLGRPQIEIEEGRHPVVEQLLERGQFVPNDTHLRGDGSAGHPRLWVLTGPNMGGKSTIMRQVGLLVILAQAGCFVPAKKARIGVVDRVFTRVGAADDLGRGDSTFMVEMRETAQILSQAGPRSLVLLDEIGRGTATFDGLAIAWAVTEYLHDQIGCQALFATHYHELCALAERLPAVANVHVTVNEVRGDIVFLHRLAPGPAGRSYGVQVGRLAGLPAGVLRRATKILARLERDQEVDGRGQLHLFSPRAGESGSRGGEPNGKPDGEANGEVSRDLSGAGPKGLLAAGELHPILDAVAHLDMDDLSPRQAYRLVESWHESLCGREDEA